MRIRLAKIALAGFIVFLIALVAMADTGHGEGLFRLASAIPAGDKLGHFVLFGILSFLVNLLLRAAEVRIWKLTLLKGSAIVLSLAIVEEVSQLFFRSRTFDFGDLTADTLGIFVFAWLAQKYLAQRRLKRAALPAKTL